MIKRLGVSLLLVAAFVAVPRTAEAVAPGCTAALPTFVGGTVRGYPDGWAVGEHIGLVVLDSAGYQLSPEGVRTGGSGSSFTGYSWVEKHVTVPATGSSDPTADASWGRCVAGNAVSVYAEFGPEDGDTPNHSRYGSAAFYGGKVTPGARMNYGLRLPLIYQLGGNTGGVQGYIWHAGKPVPAADVTRVRAFTWEKATDCGIHGIAAGPTQLSSGPGRTYYKVDWLAAGQCTAPSQWYSLQMTCVTVCGAASRNFAVNVPVKRGQWPRVDIQI